MWKTRNEAIHNKDIDINKKRHEELDQDITEIYINDPVLFVYKEGTRSVRNVTAQNPNQII